ncbi:hypothetical protein HanXRQr2_Chr09g0399221 [Helianthus annuus]|uniref:Uncharacterized protein n=1 Tax=Helianthus annuus TaxID=4232 RepID=A0A9K3N9D4_HELAN|nr:hypothetical protein HanXRQr2_Chr09g0399221 [Helianthus annuus]KAJ0894070.1 hypothetical protein HanPSC8_Chr09g0384981 [Helianthus annuus]
MLACHRSAVERRRRTKGGRYLYSYVCSLLGFSIGFNFLILVCCMLNSIFQPDFTWVLSSVAFEAAPTSNFISNWFGNSTKTQERLRATHAATNDSRR